MFNFKRGLMLTMFVCMSGCSNGSNNSVVLDSSGKHPAGWVVDITGGAHPGVFLASPSACFECHGKDLSGGISKVSCFSTSLGGFTCHPGGPSGHPAGWAQPDVHGKAAKALLAGINGLAHCQICHGVDFAGGIAKKSCLNTAGCHGAGIMAPHSQKPWRDVGRTGARSHTSTDSSNAAACAVCHTNGANSSRTPSPAAPAGTPPGCFNNTLCHGVEGHITGWASYSSHGRAAKAAAGGITIRGLLSPVSSFGACTVCHGVAYDGGVALQTCLNTAGCHGATVAAPHPARPWRSTTGGVTHTDTDTSNDVQCAKCHTNGANSTRKPLAGDTVGATGCFNNTLCHGTEGHPVGWNAAAQHGAAAKGAPTTTTGFSSCQRCHGVTFNNGPARSCTNTLGCHGLLVSAPHPAKPWASTIAGASTHTNTDPGNAGICAACHTGGANSTVKPPSPATGTAGCYNNTLCHFHQIPFAPPAVAASVHGGLAKQDLRVCQACHGTPGSTSFNGGTATLACSSCHTFAKAHPTAWQGTTTNPGETIIYSHRTAGNIANACILCHDVTQGRTAPLPAAPSCFSTTFTNGLAQTGTCHANGPGVAPHAVPYPNHNATARSNFNYCLGCHQDAANAPNSKPPGCQNCHLSSPVVTPTGCTSCHASPPGGTIYPNLANTHAQHVGASKLTVMTLACADCHTNLGFGTLDHLNRARARAASIQANPVIFSSIALVVAGGGTAPAFTGGTAGQCTNVYCHGAKMPGGDTTGTNRTPTWSTPFLPATITAAACGTCHGFPPTAASGHPTVTIPVGFPTTPLGSTCSCHANINTQTATAATYANVFVDRTKHINGTLEVSVGLPHAVPNYNHQAAGTGAACTGCHAIGTTTSVYPATVLGNAPDCRGCHRKAAPGTGCGSCHGDATGRPNGSGPNGSVFPDKTGRHQGSGDGAHLSAACTKCHILSTSGSGSTINHGPGNRNANPDIVGPGFITGITITGANKGVSPSATCNHSTINANNGGGCSGGPSSATW
ncbi:MAG: CxxxxCH/CxxCH domain-containing protein [Desulfobacteraceae bacterium]|nr:CxxxxCH/CxxCH domain-containing protein [Desulfobacteraceae bacterium]